MGKWPVQMCFPNGTRSLFISTQYLRGSFSSRARIVPSGDKAEMYPHLFVATRSQRVTNHPGTRRMSRSARTATVHPRLLWTVVVPHRTLGIRSRCLCAGHCRRENGVAAPAPRQVRGALTQSKWPRCKAPSAICFVQPPATSKLASKQQLASDQQPAGAVNPRPSASSTSPRGSAAHPSSSCRAPAPRSCRARH